MKIKIKNIMSFIISLMLMFVILATSFIIFFKEIILSTKTYIDVIEKNGIYNEIYENIYSNIDYIAMTNNIPEDLLVGVISEDEIKPVVDEYIYYIIGFMKNEESEIPVIDMEIYESRINEKIDDFLANNSEYIIYDNGSNIENMKAVLLNIIKSDLEFIDLNQLSESSGLRIVTKLCSVVSDDKLIVGMVGGILMISSLFFIVWTRRKVRRYAWIGYSFASSGMLVFLIGLSGYISGFYDNMPIAIPYISVAISAIIQKCLLSLTFIGFVVLVIGLCFMSVYWKHLYKRYKKQQLKEENIMQN